MKEYFENIEEFRYILKNPYVLEVYLKFHKYGDPTYYIADMTGEFSGFASSHFMEMVKQSEVLGYFIKEYFLNKDLYTESEIESNKAMFMTFLIKINNLLRRCYDSGDMKNLSENLGNIFKESDKFFDFTVPADAIYDLKDVNGSLLGFSRKEPIRQIDLFPHIFIYIVYFVFKRSMKTKYGILMIICDYMKDNEGQFMNYKLIGEMIEEYVELSSE